MRRFLLIGLCLATVLLPFAAQAGAAKPQPSKVKQTAKPLWALAVDGPRVAYMMNDRRVGVWNVVTGATSVIKGKYPSKGASFGFGSGEVAIAGKRVALITRFVIGNLYQTQERLYTAPVGGTVRQLGKLTNHSSYYGECDVPGSGGSDGDWIGGLVGSGKVLSVSTWRSNDSAATGGRLRLITPTGLRTIASGPGSIVSQSADRGHIAVLRSTDVWPAYQGPAEQSTPIVGIYSTGGTLLREFALNVPPLDACGYTSTFIRIALSGNQLVVLRLDIPLRGPRTATVEAYNWKTGALVHTWPLALSPVASTGTRIAVSGRVAVVSGPVKLQLLDLTTGKQVAISASRPNCPATIGSRGLVYAINPYKDGRPGKLVFVPTAKLLAALSQ
jgi:hypothetical protein